MGETLTVSEAARQLGARPRDITDLFYRRLLRDDLCPIVGDRRLIPEDYLPQVAAALRRRGKPVTPVPTIQIAPDRAGATCGIHVQESTAGRPRPVPHAGRPPPGDLDRHCRGPSHDR